MAHSASVVGSGCRSSPKCYHLWRLALRQRWLKSKAVLIPGRLFLPHRSANPKAPAPLHPFVKGRSFCSIHAGVRVL